jgi:hypothetical protein
MSCVLTIDEVRNVLNTRGEGLLSTGKHTAPNKQFKCMMCVRELRSLACNMTWSDRPDGGSPTDMVCQGLNDSLWPTNADRTLYCLPLALLTEQEAPKSWQKVYLKLTIQHIIPVALRAAADTYLDLKHKAAIKTAADICETEGTRKSVSAAIRLMNNYVSIPVNNYVSIPAEQAFLSLSSIYNSRNNINNVVTTICRVAHCYDAKNIMIIEKKRIQILKRAVELLLESHNREDLIYWSR